MASVNREIADFLKRCRAQCDPERAGLPPDGRVRRVPGLRREEVALLAGVSADYYARLEQGRPINPSPAVVEAIGHALRLDEASLAHLKDLVGVTTTRSSARAPSVQRLRPGLHRLLDSLDSALPALILGRRSAVLGANRMARALFADFDAMPAKERNYTRWLFLDKDARDLFVDWEVQARAAVENLRLDAVRASERQATQALVADLRERSEDFDHWWQQHRVHQRTHGSKRLRHPLVGELTVEYETLALPGDSETTLFLYTAEPGSASAHALNLLASWTLAEPPTSPEHSRD
ncbi:MULTISPECIES: helix-turn-helix transcriptional regulator [unclassified Streptomyces]|uniref:helix-turn-helix transcriptional regulator n=1 Tax=unclassified Streptomyces TaxID=2593676 RepID=UPI0001C1ABB9|nr:MULTISPECIES: helix-turn-helix transcriptional regulator [unclassified Streptomyces]AEN08438.1 transcriptional regulator, XRE family [Streptomyces sp. SirexAA-E]MYR69371.1 helix-turn-helix domain-containing protein [Streptomyces sp. SID4939]MYS02167.1 helix-turn-helix domain-containing protein [Streptomyces sp. SID4940]MYT66416.1 helix-turn-helix domain-containing protein [Streptomyces sp. SID8357]MYT83337.1 helix-turn-helix domain-containing protein [Streptomyces sp. SID8360]